MSAHGHRIYLSSRGWGDYTPVVWRGELDRPDEQILAECRQLLAAANDCDRSLDDQQILGLITQCRERPAQPRAQQPAGPRPCPRCGTYCDGDCDGQ